LNASFFSSFTLQDPIEIPVRLLRGNARAISKKPVIASAPACRVLLWRLPRIGLMRNAETLLQAQRVRGLPGGYLKQNLHLRHKLLIRLNFPWRRERSLSGFV
jgi:hypothetical protein